VQESEKGELKRETGSITRRRTRTNWESAPVEDCENGFLVFASSACSAVQDLNQHEPTRSGWVLMSPLTCGEVAVQFGNVFENRDARKGFDDIEDFLDLGLQVYERRLPTAFFQLFAGVRKDPKTGAANELQLCKIEDSFFDLCGHDWRKLAFQVRRGSGIKAARELHRDCSGVWTADAFLDLDFEWHMFFRDVMRDGFFRFRDDYLVFRMRIAP